MPSDDTVTGAEVPGWLRDMGNIGDVPVIGPDGLIVYREPLEAQREVEEGRAVLVSDVVAGTASVDDLRAASGMPALPPPETVEAQPLGLGPAEPQEATPLGEIPMGEVKALPLLSLNEARDAAGLPPIAGGAKE